MAEEIRPWQAQQRFQEAARAVKPPLILEVTPGSNSIDVSWRRNPGKVDGVVILLGTSPDNLQDDQTITLRGLEGMERKKTTVQNLINGQTYYVTVVAFRGESRSDITRLYKVTPGGVTRQPAVVVPLPARRAPAPSRPTPESPPESPTDAPQERTSGSSPPAAPIIPVAPVVPPVVPVVPVEETPSEPAPPAQERTAREILNTVVDSWSPVFTVEQGSTPPNLKISWVKSGNPDGYAIVVMNCTNPTGDDLVFHMTSADKSQYYARIVLQNSADYWVTVKAVKGTYWGKCRLAYKVLTNAGGHIYNVSPLAPDTLDLVLQNLRGAGKGRMVTAEEIRNPPAAVPSISDTGRLDDALQRMRERVRQQAEEARRQRQAESTPPESRPEPPPPRPLPKLRPLPLPREIREPTRGPEVAAVCGACRGDVVYERELFLFACRGCGKKYIQRANDPRRFVDASLLRFGVCSCCEPRKALVWLEGEKLPKCSGSLASYTQNQQNKWVPVSTLEYGICECCENPRALCKNGERVVCSGKTETVYELREGRWRKKIAEELPEPTSDVEAIDQALSEGTAVMLPNGIMTVDTDRNRRRRRPRRSE